MENFLILTISHPHFFKNVTGKKTYFLRNSFWSFWQNSFHEKFKYATKLVCSTFVLRPSLTEVWYEQDFCQILSHFNKQILRCCHLFTLPMKVNKTSALTLLPEYGTSPESDCIPSCTLWHAVGNCCKKFENGHTFESTTPNIPFVPWSPRRSTTMLDPFVQLLQHCWGHARVLHMVSLEFTKSYGLYPSQKAMRVQNCWELLHPFAHHCQHRCNNSQHCWAVGSCWGPLDVLEPYQKN